ncbi:hypothetical protein [Pseudomonas tohonis]|uniref:hypothetical protein n=1 Tax=Pseudomonas tohonis TaxID=2725477 RepID=UPI001F39BDC2|nr:hypothetical protein [Pseudomonas tohonis]
MSLEAAFLSATLKKAQLVDTPALSEAAFKKRKILLIITLLTCLAATTTVISVNKPSIFESFMDHPGTLVSMIITLALALATIWLISPTQSKSGSFQDIDRERIQKESFEAGRLSAQEELRRKNKKATDDSNDDDNDEELSDDEIGDWTEDFTYHVRDIIRSLDALIGASEEKASKLLDTGTRYLRSGIYFYVSTILAWQIYMFYEGPKTQIWIGIASCSLAFIVIEVLAAWFLKQYRSYVDTSLSYLRIRSMFNKFLLSYCAIQSLSAEDADLTDARTQMLKVLETDIQWPDLKELNSNDFNFMLESLGAFTSTIEKLKAVISKEKTTN